MAEMTPERDAVEKIARGIANRIDYPGSYAGGTSRAEVAEWIAAALRAERDEVAAYAAHEEQTHRILGAILGVDDSLEACARRMKERAERAEELLRRVPQAVDFLIQHRTLLHLRDTLRSLADQADGAIHDAVEPSRLADIERERDATAGLGGSTKDATGGITTPTTSSPPPAYGEDFEPPHYQELLATLKLRGVVTR